MVLICCCWLVAIELANATAGGYTGLVCEAKRLAAPHRKGLDWDWRKNLW
jgi:hypothetical protein